MADRRVQVIASGASLAPLAAVSADFVICADGGVGDARAASIPVDLVVGDLDSATVEDLEAVRRGGARVIRHPTTKDDSDLELALAAAIEHGAATVTVHLADGGRLDHQLANLAVLASSRWRSVPLDAWVGDHRVWAVHERLDLPLAVGDPVAVMAMGGPAIVTTTGVAYPLQAEALLPTQARGIANEVVSVPASVRVDEGVVLAIRSAPTGQSAQAT